MGGRNVRSGEGTGASWAIGADEGDEVEGGGFSLVDSRSLNTTGQGQRRGGQFGQRGPQQRRTAGGSNWQARKPAGKQQPQGGRFRRGGAGGGRGGRWNDWNSRDKRKVTASIEIQAAWGDPVLAIDFMQLQGQRSAVPVSETLVQAGALERFNPSFNRLTARQEKPLERHWAVDRKFYKVTTSEDPVLSELQASNAGGVYATDAIVATLMTALKSQLSWDLIVRKRGGALVLDKRDDSGIDFVTVNENSHDPPSEESDIAANTADALVKEATLLNLNLSQQVTDKDDGTGYSMPRAHPFAEAEEKVASGAYLYRRFQLGDGNAEALVVRCEVDAYKPREPKPQLLLVRALNEYDVKVTGGWRQKLEAQRAGTFATEVRNNQCKLLKWAMQAHLAEADALELAYISRTSMRDPYAHVILGVEERPRTDFLRDMSADVQQLWGVLRSVLDPLRALDDGTYLLVRDPNKKQLSVYKVPAADFDVDAPGSQ